MRITLAIDDDVLAAAKKIAASERKSAGEVIISTLARTAMRPAQPKRAMRNGVPLLPVRNGAPRVTSSPVHRLREETQ
jgi:hypothetical protein